MNLSLNPHLTQELTQNGLQTNLKHKILKHLEKTIEVNLGDQQVVK